MYYPNSKMYADGVVNVNRSNNKNDSIKVPVAIWQCCIAYLQQTSQMHAWHNH